MHPQVPLLALVFAAAIGLTLGTLGGGGSVLTVPVLVYLVGYDPKIAVPTSLGVVGAASAMGAIGHWRAGRVDLRVALTFGLVTMVGAYAGARIAVFLAGSVQLAIQSVVVVVAAILMLRPHAVRPALHRPDELPGADPRARARAAAMRQALRLVPVGTGVGLLTGTVGVGGGFIIVPALVLWGGIEMPSAVGTSLVVIALNCMIGLTGYAGHVAIPWGDTAAFTGVAVLAAAAGTVVVGALRPQRLRQIFAVFLLGVGGFVLYRTRAVFMGRSALLVAPSRSGSAAAGTPTPRPAETRTSPVDPK
jgi:hypothetical protein